MYLLKNMMMIIKKIAQNFLKQIEIYNKLTDEKCNEIRELSEKINYDDLMYHFKDRDIREKLFNDFDNAISFFKKNKKS